jgi:hypothetical protein
MSFPVEMAEKMKERSKLEGVYWAGTLIWAGLVFGASTFGVLPHIGAASAWSWLFLGSGVYGLVLDLFFASSSELTDPTIFDYMWSGFWTLVGASGFATIDIFSPAVLIIAGLALTVSLVRE